MDSQKANQKYKKKKIRRRKIRIYKDYKTRKVTKKCNKLEL